MQVQTTYKFFAIYRIVVWNGVPLKGGSVWGEICNGVCYYGNGYYSSVVAHLVLSMHTGEGGPIITYNVWDTKKI